MAHDAEYYYFIDIHLMHERVIYEELLGLLENRLLKYRALVPPVEVDYSPGVVARLRRMGIPFEVSRGKVKVESTPEIIGREDVLGIIEGRTPETVASVACRRAVKAHSEFSGEDLEKLFERYLKCRETEVCPHGRQIYYRIKKSKIMRKLGRV